MRSSLQPRAHGIAAERAGVNSQPCKLRKPVRKHSVTGNITFAVLGSDGIRGRFKASMDNPGLDALNMRVAMETSVIPKDHVLKLFEQLERGRFYGVIELHCENGRIYRVRKLHNIQREELERMIGQ